LRRCLARRSAAGLLAKTHALLVGMRRGHPDLILDSGSGRAKRGGDLTGPNPTDRGERGTEYPVGVEGEGVPVACFVPALSQQRMSMTPSSSSGCSGPPSRSWPASAPCPPTKAMTPSRIAIRAAPSGPSLVSTSALNRTDRDWARTAGRSSAATPGSWRTGAWHCAMTGSASSFNRYSRPHASSWLRAGSPANSENRLTWASLRQGRDYRLTMAFQLTYPSSVQG
jgi:hypothetical protein